jgi:hypothetical protein
MATPRITISTKHNKTAITPHGLQVVEKLAADGKQIRTVCKHLGITHADLMALFKSEPTVQAAFEEAFARGRAAIEDEVIDNLRKLGKKQSGANTAIGEALLGWGKEDKQQLRPNVTIVLPDALPLDAYLRTVANNALPHQQAAQPKGIALPAPPAESTNDTFED